MATVNVTLSQEQLEKLSEFAAKLKVSPEDLIRVTVEDLLSRPEDDFIQAADHVLKKNAELYRRLAL